MTWWVIALLIYAGIGLIVSVIAIFAEPLLFEAGFFLPIIMLWIMLIWPYAIWALFFDPMRNVGRWI